MLFTDLFKRITGYFKHFRWMSSTNLILAILLVTTILNWKIGLAVLIVSLLRDAVVYVWFYHGSKLILLDLDWLFVNELNHPLLNSRKFTKLLAALSALLLVIFNVIMPLAPDNEFWFSETGEEPQVQMAGTTIEVNEHICLMVFNKADGASDLVMYGGPGILNVTVSPKQGESFQNKCFKSSVGRINEIAYEVAETKFNLMVKPILVMLTSAPGVDVGKWYQDVPEYMNVAFMPATLPTTVTITPLDEYNVTEWLLDDRPGVILADCGQNFLLMKENGRPFTFDEICVFLHSVHGIALEIPWWAHYDEDTLLRYLYLEGERMVPLYGYSLDGYMMLTRETTYTGVMNYKTIRTR